MSLTELFKEFYYLSEVDLSHSYPWLEVFIDPYLLVRIQEEGLVIYYLRSSNQLSIPLELFNIFMSFSRFEGDHIEEVIPVTDMERCLVYGCRLVSIIFSTHNGGEDTIKSLIRVGSKELREYIQTEFNQDIPPMILENIKDRIEL